MEWLYVKSTTMIRVRYDKDSMNLDIEFNGGRMQRFSNVPESLWNSFISARSQGVFFFEQIRGKYNCSEIAEPRP